MALYIPNMNLPETCEECELRQDAALDEEWAENFCPFFPENIDFWIKAGKRHEGCPLIEVPAHGRLIDADDLRAKFPEPKDWSDAGEAFVHKTGVWARIDCAKSILPSEGGENDRS